MNALRKFLDRQEKHFTKGGKLARLYPLFEANDTFLFTPPSVTKTASHVRDALDLKRMMSVVVVSLIPAIAMALYNTGLQAHLAIAAGALPLENWQTAAMKALGLAFDPGSLLACVVHGALYFLPITFVSYAAGGLCEVIFSIVRKHEVNEGFLVTGILYPLTLPATVPLWQVALGIAFGVVFGKEVFGGTGMNILNPALAARAFLFFAYPGQITGDFVWIPARTAADGYSGATWLSVLAQGGTSALHGAYAGFERSITWWDAFVGLKPGSMGETSALACLLGAVLLLVTRIGSWRIMLGCVLGSLAVTLLLNSVGSTTNPLLDITFGWHVVLGGWAFGVVFMATDPVSAAHSETGKLIYGFLTGALAICIRTLNPAYPEGMMLAILFMNVFAATIDHFVVQANVRRRRARYVAT